MLTKDLAICIRATDFSETSQIATFFTKANGKVSAIAKGSKRPKSKFDGPIEVFAHGEIVFSDSNKEKLATLTEFQQQSFTHLANDTFSLNCCLFAIELLNSLTEDHDPHPQLFDSLQQFLRNIDERPAASSCDESRRGKRKMKDEPRPSIDGRDEQRNILALLILFQLALLKEVGLIPVFDACVNCKRHWMTQASPSATPWQASNEFYFSSSANGFVCRDCENNFPDKIKLTKKAAGCLSNRKLIGGADEKILNEIEKVLIHHFTELIGKPPKMAKYI